MPARLIALVALVALTAGCTRYSSRGQGPFAAKQGTPGTPVAGPTRIPPGPPANKSPLAMAGTTNPVPPPPPDEVKIVPPRPPEPAGFAVAEPQPPPPPVVGEPNPVVPAAAVQLPDGNAFALPPLRPRKEPSPAALPSPLAPKETAPAAPIVPSPGAQNLAQLKRVAVRAAEKWKTVDSYEARLTRQEVIAGVAAPKEEVFLQFRKAPMAIFMRNTGEVGKGREVLYNPSQHGDKMHVVIGDGDNRLVKAGFKAPPMSPDDPRVKEKSRYSIRDAGFGTTIAKFGVWVEKVEAGKIPPDAMKYAGPRKRDEYDYPLEAVEHTLRPGDDPLLPKGGTRTWHFDPKPDSPACGLPVVVTTTEPGGAMVEYYCYDKIRLPAGLTDADFHPNRLGKK